MKEFETLGNWWIPGAEDKWIAGKLTFHPVNGIKLEVFGDEFVETIFDRYGTSLAPGTSTSFLFSSPKLETICGWAENGDAVTLYQCTKSSGFKIATGYSAHYFSVRTIFWGNHFSKSEDIVFESMEINYSYLEEWAAIQDLESKLGRDKNTGAYTHFEANYKPSEVPKHRIPRFSIAFNCELHVHSFEFKDIHVSQVTFLEITPGAPLHYDNYQQNIFRQLRDFLTLGLGRAITPQVIRGKNKNHKTVISEDNIRQRYTVVFYSPQGANLLNRDFNVSDILFRYPDIAVNFDRYLTTWFDKYDKLEPVMDLYFSLFYIPYMYTHLAFLSLAQALEIFQRRSYPQKELSLRKGMERLLDKKLSVYETPVKKYIHNKESFVTHFVHTRNYYTHYNEKKKDKAVTDKNQLDKLTRRAALLMQLCFLAELSFPPDEVERLTKNNRSFQEFSH